MKKLILLLGITCLPLSVSYGALTCNICKEEGEKFSCHKYQTMILHLAGAHNLYKCPHCGKYIKGGDVYKKHIKAHGRRACLFCMTLTFKNEEAYQSHKDAVHLPPTEYKWICFACEERLPTLERSIIHAFVQHKYYACPHCIKKGSDEEDGTELINISETPQEYWKHMGDFHGEFACLLCNMRTFKTQKDYNDHCNFCNVCRKSKAIEAPCNHCKHLNKFRNKAEQNLHELQHAFLLFFLEQTICGYTCCVSFRKAVADTYAEVKRLGKGKKDDTYVKKKINPAIQAVRTLANHILENHKRCLFCENRITEESQEQLKAKLGALTYRQIADDARMFLQPNENAFSESTIPVFPCDMCGSALQPNRKSRLFFASIAKFPIGKGLDVRDYPFHHLEYDELKVQKNTMMSVIKEVSANEEESRFIPEEEEKEDVILGEEDENGKEEEEEEKEEEDKKEEKAKVEPKKEK